MSRPYGGKPLRRMWLLQATLEDAVAERPHPLGGMRKFQLHEMEDFDDISWWMRTVLTWNAAECSL